MSSTPYGEPLELLLRPSRLIGTLLCLMHMAAVLVVAPLPIIFSWRVVLLFAVVSSFFWNLYIYMQRTPKRVHWSRELGWTLTDRQGKEHPVTLLPEAYLSPWLVIPHFKDEQGKRRTVMIAQDSVRPDAFRHLKVLLRYGAPKR